VSFATENVSFAIERITVRFYTGFKRERAAFITAIEGISNSDERERYASLLLHRFMFLYFLQHKGFLDGDKHYLSNKLWQMQEQHGPNLFYHHFLLLLFHQGLSSPARTPHQLALLGNVPYVDGDLFSIHTIEQNNPHLNIPDQVFSNLLHFFGTYSWSLHSSATRAKNEITPDILGYIFEKYVNQQQMGAYYTKEDVTEYIAKNTIIPYLFDRVAQRCPQAFQQQGAIWSLLQADPDRYIYTAVRQLDYLSHETRSEYRVRRHYYTNLRVKLLSGHIHSIDDVITYNLDICRFAQDVINSLSSIELARTFYEELQQITVLDPTCGSGAFLFAALNILEPLYRTCLARIDGYAAQETGGREQAHRRYHLLKSIIVSNLYGVDIMEEAIEICKLRFLLKLVTEIDSVHDLELLPAIGCNIHVGNALIGSIVPIQSAIVEKDQQFAMEGQLHRRLAVSYGIDITDAQAYATWLVRHKPFHWSIHYATIINKGGFSVIIGNPPYVEYKPQAFPYQLHEFTTLSCSNLYPYVIERSRQLLARDGRHGMILPLAAFATRNMLPLLASFQRWFPTSWQSFYHFRPSMLFSGGKVASIPTAIYLAKATGPERRFSTHINKWFSEQRHLLFPTLKYCEITIASDNLNLHYFPKFGHVIENSIMEKVRCHEPVVRYLAQTTNHNTMYYRSAGGLYWKVFTNFPWPYHTTSNKQCSFHTTYQRDVFVALFNSSLFWWYYTVTFDTFNLKDYMLFGFRYTYPDDQSIVNALAALCNTLMNDFYAHARHLTRGRTGSYTIYAKKSKAIIDEIDDVLAYHYGLNDEELDFIVHYDIKYRLGLTHTMHH